MSDHAVIRDALVARLTPTDIDGGGHTGLPSGVTVIPVNSQEEMLKVMRTVPTVGVAMELRTFDPKAKAIGVPKQNSDWLWSVYYCAPGPGPGVAVGLDVYSLLTTGREALLGWQLTSVGLAGGFLLGDQERLIDLPPGALLYVQTWKQWQQAVLP